MAKLFLTVLLSSVAFTGAHAQSGLQGQAAEPHDGPLNSKYLAASGATVPKPDLLPPGARPRKSDRWSYDRDERIERSICTNC